MVEPKLQVVLQRRDCARNVARFYVLAIEPSLYGDAALMRAWGRIGSLGRQRLDLYASAAEAGEALEAWLARRVGRGYTPVTARSHSSPGAHNHGNCCRGYNGLAQQHRTGIVDIRLTEGSVLLSERGRPESFRLSLLKFHSSERQ